MAATAARVKALRGAGGRFRWRTPVVAGGVRGAAQDAAGRVGSGQEYASIGVQKGCPSGRCPCVRQSQLGQNSSSFQPPSIPFPDGEIAGGPPCQKFCWVE